MSESILLVGCGKQSEKHISGLRAAGIENIILHDIDPKLSSALAKRMDLDWCEDISVPLGDASLAAIDICTPTPTHAPLITSAFNAGKHVFCEKPLCENLAQANDLVKLADQTGLKCGIGYIYRFAPVFEELHKMLHESGSSQDDGPMGKLKCASLRIGGRGSHAVWKHQKATGGGAINEMIVHMLDLAIWLFGTQAELEVITKQQLCPTRVINGESVEVDAEDYVVVRGKFGGVEVLFQADMLTPEFSQLVTLQGENASFMGSIQPQIPSHVFLSQPSGSYEKGSTSLEFAPANLFEKQMADFVQAIREPDHQPRCSLEEARVVMENDRKHVSEGSNQADLRIGG